MQKTEETAVYTFWCFCFILSSLFYAMEYKVCNPETILCFVGQDRIRFQVTLEEGEGEEGEEAGGAGSAAGM